MSSTRRREAGRKKPIPGSFITTGSPKAVTLQPGNSRNCSVRRCEPRSSRFVNRAEASGTRTGCASHVPQMNGALPMNRPEKTFTATQIHLERRLPSYWRVTFDHPPLNIFGPDTIPQLDEIITALETDPQVKVVVFDSAVN